MDVVSVTGTITFGPMPGIVRIKTYVIEIPVSRRFVPNSSQTLGTISHILYHIFAVFIFFWLRPCKGERFEVQANSMLNWNISCILVQLLTSKPYSWLIAARVMIYWPSSRKEFASVNIATNGIVSSLNNVHRWD